MTTKEKAISVIQRLPEDANLKDVSDEIALLLALEEAGEDIREGRTVSNEEMRNRIRGWTGN